MTEMIRLCRVEDVIADQPHLLEDENVPSLTVFNSDGQYYVTDTLCTHGMALLSDGYLEGFVIECPLHGGSFDIRTGAALTAPCEVALRTYPVTLADGWITIAASGLQDA